MGYAIAWVIVVLCVVHWVRTWRPGDDEDDWL